MLVTKVNNTSFNGYRHDINSAGDHVYKISYPHDYDKQNVKIEFYKGNAKNGDTPIKTIELKDTDTINFNEIPELDKEDVIAYRVYVDGKHVADTGFYTTDRNSGAGFNLINRAGTKPIVQGQSVLTMPDIHRPGAYYYDFKNDKTGSINYDVKRQKHSESIVRTTSNSGGGTLAGIEYDIEELKKMGVKKLFMTPVWGYDNLSSPHYSVKNDVQIPDNVGNIENYETFIRKLYKNGIQTVDDFAVTSYGLESQPFQYALRWAGQNPQTYYWFRLNGLNDGPLTLGIVPKNKKENLRWRVINPPKIYNAEKRTIQNNPNYNPNREVIFQVYDSSQVTPEQLNSDEIIRSYKNTYSENKLLINNSEDTLLPYAFEIKPTEYENRLEEFAKMNKNLQTPIELNSPEGALLIGQFTNFKIGTEAEGAVFWDANKDLLKRNYYISPYDEKLINAIPDITERSHKNELIKRGNCEAKDTAIQAGVYRAQTVKDFQTLYTAQVLKNASSKEDIDRFIGKSLPKEAELSSKAIENVIGGWYNLERKGIEPKNDITIKALMKLPLDSLELGENTSGVLATSFFTNRAINDETIGMSRYKHYKQGLGVYEPYSSTYYSVNRLYETKLRYFTDEVINTVNRTSPEKLLDSKGNYTEYGEYVINLLGKDIAKYAFLKAIAGENLQYKIMPNDVLKGKITYNYPELRKSTTLKALGISASSPEEEAKALERIISEGLNKLDRKDIEFVAKSVSKQIEGTTTEGFRLAEAMTNKAGLGLDFRLDAAKDVVDMDAVRNGDMSFDEAWDQVIDFWKKYVKEIKKVNPNAYIVAEITDIDQLLRAIYGQDTDVWNMDLSSAGGKYKNVPDAERAFFRETGVTSEAAYSYTFTDLLHVFSADGESGNLRTNGMAGFKERIQTLINTNDIDYIKNTWTFADNHDKPSILHAMALDMELFHTDNLTADFKNSLTEFNDDSYEKRRRNARISVLQELTNSDKFENLPLEAMMNIDNKEYFNTANTRAVAMSKLMRDALNERIPDSFEKKDAIKQALVDLSNGHYLTNETNINLQTINIQELKSLENALDVILSNSGLILSETDKKEIIEKAKERERVEKYAVRGDFDWNGGRHWTAIELSDRAYSLGINDGNRMQYSPYTISVSALLADSYNEVLKSKNIEQFKKGAREFVQKYNRAVIENSKTKLPYTPDSDIVKIQKAYASRDFETVIEMIIQQAEFKTGKIFHKSEHDYVMKELFEASTEPAVQKALMYSAYLSALPGNPSIYYRDVLGGLGYDEKAKNVFLQNRNTVKYSQIEEDGPLKEYRTKIFNEFKEVMRIRSKEGMEAINNGTPYMLETNNPDVMAMLYDDDRNNTVITILSAYGIDPHNRAEYIKDTKAKIDTVNNNNKHVPVNGTVELDEITIPASLGLTAGTIFVSMNGKEKIEYIVKKAEDGFYKLVRKDGKKIRIDSETAKRGVMFLKKVFGIPFKGKPANMQYNFVSNPYAKTEKHNLGENLSIVVT